MNSPAIADLQRKDPYHEHFSLFIKHLKGYQKTLARRKPKELYEACHYILELGGKRLRPVLALAACDVFGKHPDKALGAAMAVELFHNFSLIHDDILDNAPLRRGKPTVHEKWNTGLAILSGDVMLVEAQMAFNEYPPALAKNLATLFNKTAVEVCEGQQMDMNFETSTGVSVKEYLKMIGLKTAVLIGCSLQMGAMCAGAGIHNQKAIYVFGKNLGIAFQLMDDYLDVFGESHTFGKKTGGDILAAKKTFMLLKAMERLDSRGKKELKALITSRISDSEKISGVVRLYRQAGADILCLKEAEKHTRLAIKNLESIKAPAGKKEIMKQFALNLLQRAK